MTPAITTPMPTTPRDLTRAFIRDNFLLAESCRSLADHESLVDREIVDSTGFLELIGFVEETFDIHVDEDDMVIEHFGSIDAIVAYVARKHTGTHTAAAAAAGAAGDDVR